MTERHAAEPTSIRSERSFFRRCSLLTVSQIRNPFTPLGRAIDIALEMWAVLVVAGSAGAFAAFLQDADRPR
jgi:hypothetical protein